MDGLVFGGQVNPAAMTDDQLADVVIEGGKKLQHYPPYIRTLKDRFDTGDRDSTNRLKTPIKDCSSWKEFCKTHLDRTPETIRLAFQNKKSQAAIKVLAAKFVAFEKDHPTIRQSTANMISEGRTPTDVVAALVGMNIPKPIAEAAVRIVVGDVKAIVYPATRILSPEEQNRPKKDATVIFTMQQQITRTTELNQLFRNAEVTRSITPGRFNLTLRDLTDAEVQVIAEQYGRKE